jgi:hypothetical protein
MRAAGGSATALKIFRGIGCGMDLISVDSSVLDM